VVFETASIRPAQTPQGAGLAAFRESINPTPGGLTLRNVSLRSCIRWAYDLKPYQLVGPDWLKDRRFDVIAKAGSEVSEDQLRQMLRALLADRFKLVIHRQSRELAAYALLVGKAPLKLQRKEGDGQGTMTGAGLVYQAHGVPVSRLANILTSMTKFPVLDMTGLDGVYDFTLDMRPYLPQRQPGDPPLDLVGIASSAMQEQLGLKLESRRAHVEITVVDHAERTPGEN
jgi:uncharacterized protein (TIGR03435 family)